MHNFKTVKLSNLKHLKKISIHSKLPSLLIRSENQDIRECCRKEVSKDMSEMNDFVFDGWGIKNFKCRDKKL